MRKLYISPDLELLRVELVEEVLNASIPPVNDWVDDDPFGGGGEPTEPKGPGHGFGDGDDLFG